MADYVKRVGLLAVVVGVVMFLIVVPVSIVSMCMLFVGPLVVETVLTFLQAHIQMQLYAEYLRRGGTVIVMKPEAAGGAFPVIPATPASLRSAGLADDHAEEAEDDGDHEEGDAEEEGVHHAAVGDDFDPGRDDAVEEGKADDEGDEADHDGREGDAARTRRTSDPAARRRRRPRRAADGARRGDIFQARGAGGIARGTSRRRAFRRRCRRPSRCPIRPWRRRRGRFHRGVRPPGRCRRIRAVRSSRPEPEPTPSSESWSSMADSMWVWAPVSAALTSPGLKTCWPAPVTTVSSLAVGKRGVGQRDRVRGVGVRQADARVGKADADCAVNRPWCPEEVPDLRSLASLST